MLEFQQHKRGDVAKSPYHRILSAHMPGDFRSEAAKPALKMGDPEQLGVGLSAVAETQKHLREFRDEEEERGKQILCPFEVNAAKVGALTARMVTQERQEEDARREKDEEEETEKRRKIQAEEAELHKMEERKKNERGPLKSLQRILCTPVNLIDKIVHAIVEQS